jgi:hypothetical protein
VSNIVGTETFIFHTDLGPVVTQVQTVARYDVEDVVRNRAIALARKLQFYRLGQKASPNDPKVDRTMVSVYSSSTEELLT